jgi:MFS family permease
VAVLAGVLVAWRILHHPVPVVEPSLLRVRTFAWSNAAALTYGTAFGASLLISVLWVQDVWHYRPLVAGLAIAPGPLTAGPFTVVADRLARRLPLGVVTAFGCLVFGAGAVFLLATVGEHPHFASEFLPGWMIGGAGVGLTLPAILSSATANLPPARVATGSAVVSMSRQIGMALGVSILVAVLGSPVGWAATHAAFQAGWWAVAAISAVAAVSALGMTPRQAAVEVAVGEQLVAATVDSGVTA